MQFKGLIAPVNNNSDKSAYIERIGPWAFQSFSRNKWHEVSDEQLIAGALLSAPKSEKLMLLDFFSLFDIMRIWKAKVVIQDDWSHENNIWIAANIFKSKSPEKFVSLAYQDANKIRQRDLEHGRFISRR